jgi:hypothetical protein
MTPKSAFAKICKNLNSYQYTEEFKKGKKLVESSLERERKQAEILRIFKWLFSEESLKYKGCPFAAEVNGTTLYFKTKGDYKAIAEWLEEGEAESQKTEKGE